MEDPIASYSPPEWVLNDADEANLQTSWRRYNARCRRTDHLRLYAALSSGTFALHNLSARMHRAEALYFRDDSAKRVYDSPRVGFFEAYTRLYGVRLRRSIELQRGIVRVRPPTLGSSTIAWGETVSFSGFRRYPRRRLPWPIVPTTTTLSRYRERASHIAAYVESSPDVAPSDDTLPIPALPSAANRVFVWNLPAQLSYLVYMLFLWLTGVAAFLARRLSSWVVSRRITLFSLLRATYGGAAEVYVSLCHDCVWFFHWILFAIAGVTTAWSASTAAIFPLIAGAWNAVATLFLFGAAMEGEKHARIDRLDSLEFVHFLQTAHFPSCCVFPVSPEFLRMYVHANRTCSPQIGRTFLACTKVLWSLTASLASPLLVGRKLASTELIIASLDIGGSPSPSVGVKLSYGGAYLPMVRLRTLILEYDKRVAFS